MYVVCVFIDYNGLMGGLSFLLFILLLHSRQRGSRGVSSQLLSSCCRDRPKKKNKKQKKDKEKKKKALDNIYKKFIFCDMIDRQINACTV
jgi:hypothetical protein